jgi:phage terminase large subunit-like protein
MMTASDFRALPRKTQLDLLKHLSNDEAASMFYDWSFWARENQLQPGGLGKNGKDIWFIQAGRGFGKNRTGAEWIIDKVQNDGYRHVSLIGAAADEVRDYMIEGESGILAWSPPWFMPEYIPSKKLIVWPNGAKARIFYGTEPEKSRGSQSDLIWGDELCKWKYPDDTYSNVMFGHRLGRMPLALFTSTPKPIPLVKKLVKDPRCIITRGTTYDNMANLAPTFISQVIKEYEGTRLGRQELNGEILDDNPNALFKRVWIDGCRIKPDQMPTLSRIIIPVDPAVSNDEDSDEHGIIPVGMGPAPRADVVQHPDMIHYYVLDDATMRGTPREWGAKAVDRYRFWNADRIVAEVNQGGDLVEENIRNIDRNVPYSKVWASRGKVIRAEPISTLYEQGRVHHVGSFASLEDELCEWIPGMKSPNRLDSLVWGITFMTDTGQSGVVSRTLQPTGSLM